MGNENESRTGRDWYLDSTELLSKQDTHGADGVFGM